MLVKLFKIHEAAGDAWMQQQADIESGK